MVFGRVLTYPLAMMYPNPRLVLVLLTAILASSTPAVAADWVLWEKLSVIAYSGANPPDKITTIGVYPTKSACAAAALKLAQEQSAPRPGSLAFPFVEGPRAGAGAAYVWNGTAASEFYEATCWPVGVNPK